MAATFDEVKPATASECYAVYNYSMVPVMTRRHVTENTQLVNAVRSLITDAVVYQATHFISDFPSYICMVQTELSFICFKL
jgi:hypothetical protein